MRAITRVATPDTDEALLEMTGQRTASHLERIVRAYRKAQRVDEMDQANRTHEDRSLRWYHDDDGTFVLQARPTPEQGALVRRALERAGEADDDVSAETSEERRTRAQMQRRRPGGRG